MNEMRCFVETAHKKLLLRKMDSALIATQRYDKTKVSTGNEADPISCTDNLVRSYNPTKGQEEEAKREILMAEWSEECIDWSMHRSALVRKMHEDYNDARRIIDNIENWSFQECTKGQLDELIKQRRKVRQYDLVSARWLVQYYAGQYRYSTTRFRFVLDMVDNEGHDFNNAEAMLEIYTTARDHQYAMCNGTDSHDNVYFEPSTQEGL